MMIKQIALTHILRDEYVSQQHVNFIKDQIAK